MVEELKIDNDQEINDIKEKNDYKYGFVTDIESETIPKGLTKMLLD